MRDWRWARFSFRRFRLLLKSLFLICNLFLSLVILILTIKLSIKAPLTGNFLIPGFMLIKFILNAMSIGIRTLLTPTAKIK
jgi:hypothetical protein